LHGRIAIFSGDSPAGSHGVWLIFHNHFPLCKKSRRWLRCIQRGLYFAICVPWQEFVFRFPLTVAHFALMIINEPAVRIRDVVTGQTKSKSESRVNKLYKRQLRRFPSACVGVSKIRIGKWFGKSHEMCVRVPYNLFWKEYVKIDLFT